MSNQRTAVRHAIALNLLVLTVYTDISDAAMRTFHIPSLLQLMIAVLAFAVWLDRRALRPGEAIAGAPLLLLGGWTLLVFSTSVWASDAAAASGPIGEAFKALLIAILVASLAYSWRSLRSALASLVIAAAGFSAISIVQVSTGHMRNALWGLLTLRTGTIFGETELPRAAGPPVHDPNFYARILLLALPLSIALAVAQRTHLRRNAWFAAAAVIAAGVLVTYSRGAMLTLGVIALLTVVALRVPLKFTLSAAIVLVLMVPLLPPDIGKRLTTLESLVPGDGAVRDSSVELRKLWARTAVKMFEDHPLLGVGAGQFGVHYYRYSYLVGSTAYDYDPAGVERYPHSLYLQLASETGLAGLVLFGLVIASAFAALRRARQTLLARGEDEQAMVATSLAISIAGYLVASAFLHESNLRYPALILGLTCAVARLARTGVAPQVIPSEGRDEWSRRGEHAACSIDPSPLRGSG